MTTTNTRDDRDDRVVVTNENFGDLLIQSAQEALAYTRGDTTKGRVRVRAVPDVPPPPPAYDADRIRALRLRLGLRQDDFARALNVSGKTVRAWEQGVNTPSGPALRLLQIADTHPEMLAGIAAG